MSNLVVSQKRFDPKTPLEAVEVLTACSRTLTKVCASTKVIQFSGLVRLRDEKRRARAVLAQKGYK